MVPLTGSVSAYKLVFDWFQAEKKLELQQTHHANRPDSNVDPPGPRNRRQNGGTPIL